MIFDNLALAFGGILANKVCSFLTMLSIGIGVFAVITLTAVAAGAVSGTEQQLEGLGSPKLINVYGGFISDRGPFAGGVEPGGIEPGGGDPEADAFEAFDPRATPYLPPPPQQLSEADIALLNDPSVAPDVAAASGSFSFYGPMSTDAGGYTDTEILGTDNRYARVIGLPVTAGTYLTEADVAARARVVVLSTTAAGNLGADVGSTVIVNGTTYDVIGTTDDTYPGQPTSYMPESTIQDTLLGPQQGYPQVYVLAADEAVVESAADQVRAALRASHLLGPLDAADFEVYTRTEELRSVRAISIILQVLAAAIAGIALFVGGIGVMNIMLVTVTERTREIGIRKAIGAQHHHLLGQFLLEAVTLTFTGGLFGLLLGSLVQFISIQGFSPEVTPLSVILALTFSIGTGVFFGLYPANRAASLPPIQALRYE